MDSVTLSVEELPLGVTALPPLLVLGVAQVTSDGNSPFLSPPCFLELSNAVTIQFLFLSITFP